MFLSTEYTIAEIFLSISEPGTSKILFHTYFYCKISHVPLEIRLLSVFSDFGYFDRKSQNLQT